MRAPSVGPARGPDVIDSSMDAQQIEDIIQLLRDPDESSRLKGANLLTKADPSRCGAAIPVLKELFWSDPNPAVKFLAKRALVQLGENIEAIQSQRASALSSLTEEAEDGTGPLHDHEILWRCAQEELRTCMPELIKLIEAPEERVRFQTSDALEKLGTVLSAAPLLEAFEREQTRPAWRESSTGRTSVSADDISDLIHIAKLKRSGINPAIAAKMGNLNCPEVLEAFLDMLRSGNVVLQNNAVRILADLSNPHTIEPMLRLLGSEDAILERKVIKTLSKIAADSKTHQVQVIRSILSHFKPTESEFKLYSIVEAIGRIHHPKTLPFIEKCLKHKLPRVRANAVEALCRFELPKEELVRLAAPLLHDENNRVVANCVAALWGTSVQPKIKETVDRCVESPEKWHRASIAFALGETNVGEAVPYIIRLMKDSDGDVRRNAIKALKKMDSREAIGRLVEFVHDDDYEVRVHVVEQIGRSQIDAYNDVLHLLMIDAEQAPRLLATVILSLGHMGLAENIPTISYYLNDRDDRIRANAVEALQLINDPKVMSLIQLSLSDNDSRVRSNAAKALWFFGELRAVDTVRTMMQGGQLDYQASGAYAMGEMARAVREKSTLIQYPLLIEGLRRHPRYHEFERILGGDAASA